jgi:hypothetical protein
MKLKKIYSTRKNNKAVYADLIYEWEEEYAKHLDIPIYSYNSVTIWIINKIFRILNIFKLSSFFQSLENKRSIKYFVFVYELYPRRYFSFQVFSNKIPFIIDFDYFVNIENFYSVYKNCKVVIISNFEAYNYLKSKGCPLNIVHIPLGVAGRYHVDLHSALINKEYDAIMVRSNKVFNKYLQRYAQENQNFEYIIRRWQDGELYKKNFYYSNKRGNIGEFSNRNDYFMLLKKTKVALYTTPGYDEETKRFMNHVTPSLFEFISAGCKIIARYPQNTETEYFRLNDITRSINNYNMFKETMDVYLNSYSNDHLEKHSDYMNNFYIKNYIPVLLTIIEEIK